LYPSPHAHGFSTFVPAAAARAMRARKKSAVRPARRQVTFAWPAAAAAALFALTVLRWPRAPHTPVRAQPPLETPFAMAYVEIPGDARGFLWPRDFTQGLTDSWPRAMDVEAAALPPTPPPPFREWPADGPAPVEVPVE